MSIKQDNILRIMFLCLMFELVSIPLFDMYIKLGLPSILSIHKIETRDAKHLPGQLLYKHLTATVQWINLAPLVKINSIEMLTKMCFFN